MDPTKYKRRDPRQTTQKHLGNAAPSTEVFFERPQNRAPIRPRPFAEVTPARNLPKIGNETLGRLRSVESPTQAAPPVVPERSIAVVFAQESTPEVAIPTSDHHVETTAPKVTRIPGFTMDLPGEEPKPRYHSLIYGERPRRIRRWAFRGVAVAMVFMITVGGLLISQAYSKSNKVFRGTTGTAAALRKNVEPELLGKEGSGRINVLLLGRGGGTHAAPDLTDTMMVASIDPLNHKVVLLSIPRDLWVTVPGQGAMKINAAWETGEFKYLGRVAPGSKDPKAIQAGFDTVDATVEDVLGINIDYNMIVNFQAFRQAVDTVGGVTVDVPTDLVDPTMAWENGNDPTLAHAGAGQLFDGRKALIYVRSRETTSDFARTQRQRAVLLALKTKVVTLGTLSNPVKLSGLLNAFGDNVSTDMSVTNAVKLYNIIKDVPDVGTTSIAFNNDGQTPLVSTGNLNGQSVVIPKLGLFKYADMQAFVKSQLLDPYIIKEHARVRILNGTTTPGVATAQSNQLKALGYNVTGAANTPNTGWSETMLIDLSKGKKPYTKHYLEQHYGVTARTKIPDDTVVVNGADFVIIVGSNAVTPTQTQTN